MTAFAPILEKALSGAPLSAAEMRRAMDLLLENAVAEADIAAFLLALRARGETVEEIAAAAEAMRAKALRIHAPEDAIDTCGTGGDGAETLNISTAVAFVVAGCGVPVAKHGNRAASSKSGSSDVLAALGVKIEARPETIERSIRDAKICFMFAAYHHRAVAHVAAVRRKLGVRTLFNVLGPLANPALARRQLMGVYDRALTAPLAEALGRLGSIHAWVVAGSDGLDELTTTGPSFVSAVRSGAVQSFTIAPEDAGVSRANLADLKGGDPAYNATRLRGLLAGETGPYRDIVLLNAAAALVIADKATTLAEGVRLAAASIDERRAIAALDRLIAVTNEVPR
jgi:anthranilate phosphoribosyltransferase